ncbi:MAG: methionyl-tRNA formyltransferase [Bacillota bacterium]|nr:methionyl-tRNA formyltransferase [Bacillota bacterium]
MKIVYMGTPDFAVKPLEALVNSGYDVALVVSKADRAKDRGKKMQSCPVKLKAQELGIPVETPEKIKGNEEFISKIKELNPDLIVVAAYGKILPLDILNIPRLGCVNIHGSLLPKYRGAAPIQRAVIEGAEKTGITLMYMAEGMDTGDMIAKAETSVDHKTADELFVELSALGADLLVKYIPLIENGTAPREKQNDEEATLAPMVYKETIDWTKSAHEIDCLIRGTDCQTVWNGQVMKVHMAEEAAGNGEPGTVIHVDKKTVEIACGNGSLKLKNIQMPGKKAMPIDAFLLGNKIEEGCKLG